MCQPKAAATDMPATEFKVQHFPQRFFYGLKDKCTMPGMKDCISKLCQEFDADYEKINAVVPMKSVPYGEFDVCDILFFLVIALL